MITTGCSISWQDVVKDNHTMAVQVTEQDGTVQLFAAVTCPFLDILLQHIAVLYLLAQ